MDRFLGWLFDYLSKFYIIYLLLVLLNTDFNILEPYDFAFLHTSTIAIIYKNIYISY